MDLKEKIFNIGQIPQIANFATVTENGKPTVRYVIGNLDNKLNFRFSTFLNSRKVKHIKHNPNVHLSLGISDMNKPDQWLQISGNAIVSTDQSERNAFWNDELKEFFKGPNDENYAIIIVKPEMIVYEKMGSPIPEVWKASN
jgi:general stress protein 26